MNVSYYPIKKNEIIQIIKMIKQYKNKEFSDINHFFEKYNMNQTNKDDFYSAFNECTAHMDDSSFDESYGLCIAKTQKIFRGNFNFNDKSITQLLHTIPYLTKYRINWETFIQTKDKKIRFNNELKDENVEASGVYISYDKLKSLYTEYQNNANIRTLIDQYYGSMSDKFIRVINYCLENECGLLEANFSVRNIVQLDSNKEININTATNQVDSKDRPIVSTSTKIWTIIAYKILFELITVIVINNIKNLLLLKIESTTIQIIVSVITTVIAVFFEWFGCIHLSFSSTTVEKSKLPTMLKSVTIIFLVAMIIGTYSNYKSFFKIVDEEVTYTITTDKEIINKGLYVHAFGTSEQKNNFNKSIEEFKKEVINGVLKEMIPYYIAVYAINIVGLFYARKLVKKMI